MKRFVARKRFGQNFLVSRDAVVRIVEALVVRPGEPVLEIGPGRGALTRALVEVAGRIAAIELDRDLARALRDTIAADRLVLIEADVLGVPLASIPERLGCAASTPVAVAGNLPYNVSKPIAVKLIAERADVARAVLMFQREVADRLTAGPGSRAYGPLSVLAGFAYRIERLFDLPPSAFRPRPKVVSTVTRWRPRPGGLDPLLEPSLRRTLTASFAQRRKTMLANLRFAFGGDLDEARGCLAAAGIDGALRPEQVPPDAFLALAKAWPA